MMISGGEIMALWEEANAASVSAFTAVAGDVGNTYQQVLFGSAGNQSQDMTQHLMRSSVNPEYARAEQAYVAQEQEREHWEGITVADYQPTDIDWQEYGRYSAEQERGNS